MTDECLYNAVEWTSIIFPGRAKGEEILGRLWCRLAEDLEFEVTESSMKLDTSQLGSRYQVQLNYRDRHGALYIELCPFLCERVKFEKKRKLGRSIQRLLHH